MRCLGVQALVVHVVSIHHQRASPVSLSRTRYLQLRAVFYSSRLPYLIVNAANGYMTLADCVVKVCL